MHVAPDDPRREDVRALLARHLAFAHEHTPVEHVHALDVDALVGPDIAFVSCRDDGLLLGVGALKRLGDDLAEVKSMHTAAEARGRGVARLVLGHLVELARAWGVRTVSLETGTMDAFAAARGVYAASGFVPCGPFADYPVSETSAFMTLELG